MSPDNPVPLLPFLKLSSLCRYGVDVDGEAEGEGAASPWVIRIELDKDKVAAKRVQLEDLQALIIDVFGPDTFQIIVSDQNMPRQVLRLRFVPDDEEDVDIEFLKSVEEQIRTKLKVSGYDKILKVSGGSGEYFAKAKPKRIRGDWQKELVRVFDLSSFFVSFTGVRSHGRYQKLVSGEGFFGPKGAVFCHARCEHDGGHGLRRRGLYSYHVQRPD